MSSELCISQVSESGVHTPVEIDERIIDFLHDDFLALCASSLVHRSWISATRYHIFSRAIISQFWARGGKIKENVSTFLALLHSPHCTILSAIKSVILHIMLPNLIQDVVGALAEAPALTAVLFVDYTSSTESQSISWIAQKLPNIQRFSYDTCTAPSEDAIYLVSAFTHLQCLSIYTPRHSPTFTLPTDRLATAPFLHLSTLRLSLHNSEQLLQWLLHSCQNLALETFELRIYSPSHRGWGPVSVLNSFLVAQANTLSHLSIGIEYLPKDRTQSKGACLSPRCRKTKLNHTKGSPVNLSALSNIRSLTLRTHDIEAICDSLATLTTSSLEVITVDVLRWTLGLVQHCQCDCLQLLELRILGRLMEEKAFLPMAYFKIGVPNSLLSQEGDWIDSFHDRRERKALETSLVDEDGHQVDSLDSVMRVVLKRTGLDGL